jgi:hypothetical protein
MLDNFSRHNTKIVEMDYNQFGTQLVDVIFFGVELQRIEISCKLFACNYVVVTMTNYKILNFF